MTNLTKTDKSRRVAATCISAIAAGATIILALPQRPLFSSERGAMMVFPGDSLELAEMTFMIDGDTVTREQFFKLDRKDIRSLIVTPEPANLIEVVTRRAAIQPLEPDSLPDDVDYIVDGTIVDRTAFTDIPANAISSLVVVKGPRCRIEVTTVKPHSALKPNDK
ncbi:MAG: hypothetical protein K2N66_01230 [Paramuribaculum sp.]|nr:hypothetical protein [Paramuribaculum sp.]